MTHQVVQTRRFARQYKKLHDTVVADVNAAIAKIAAGKATGDRKKGDLAALYVLKFNSQKQLYLLGYTLDNALQLVYLEAVGPHENFYRDLKQ